MFKARNRFFPLRWVFMSSVILFWYTSFTLPFILTYIILSSSKTPRYLYPPTSTSPISSPFDSWIPSHLVFYPFCSNTKAHFKIPNSIFISSLHCHIVLIKESISLSFFPYSFKSSMKNRWLTFAPFLSTWYPIPVSLSIWINANKAITNSNGENELPWNIPHLVGTDSSSFPSAYQLVFHLFMLCSIRCCQVNLPSPL